MWNDTGVAHWRPYGGQEWKCPLVMRQESSTWKNPLDRGMKFSLEGLLTKGLGAVVGMESHEWASLLFTPLQTTASTLGKERGESVWEQTIVCAGRH